MASTTPRGPVAARTVIEVVRLSTGYLRDRGSPSARLDSELLVGHAVGLSRLDLYLQYDRPLSDPELDRVRELLRRRGRGEPVAHLVGCREFFGRSFRVTPAVLVPRPETETLVDRALRAARERDGEVRIADLGTGSGCIGCTLAAELGQSSVLGCDVSPEALAVAAENAAALGVASRVLLVEGGWEKGLVADLDLVVSNPPYVTTAELEGLPRDLGFEPRVALDGGVDGLEAYRVIFPAVAERCPGARWIGVEVDSRRAGLVADMARSVWPDATVAVANDLAGLPRVVEVRP
ncbi:MAG TPA: peptide chain release factor N(5)-glutamine methyltransferase [Candidatus Binatia bacterium]|nr:peptide chain release factor N(5)-glutamine methyltransferase [Candidatus Binatia bacterium]